MGALAECWQTPYSQTSPTHCAGTGRRVGMPWPIPSKNVHYHHVHHDVAGEHLGRGERDPEMGQRLNCRRRERWTTVKVAVALKVARARALASHFRFPMHRYVHPLFLLFIIIC